MESIGIGDYVESGLTLFGKEVNANRQLVLELDGLKPIYRRLIYTALQYPDKMVKTATIIGACLSGETEILDVNLNKIKLKDLPKLMSEKDVFTFSFSDKGEPEVTKILKCWITKKESNLIKITLDNGESILSSYDHKFMLRDGTFVTAESLTSGQSLMPINYGTYEYKGYRKWITNNLTGHNDPIYQLVGESRYIKIEDNPNKEIYHIHHIDHNSLNDDPSNLIKLPQSKHASITGSKSLSEYNASGELSKRNIENWKDPKYRDYMIERLVTRTRENFKNSARLIIQYLKENNLELTPDNFYKYRIIAWSEKHCQGRCPADWEHLDKNELDQLGFHYELESVIDRSLLGDSEDLDGMGVRVYFTCERLNALGITEVDNEDWKLHSDYGKILNIYDSYDRFPKIFLKFDIVPVYKWYPEMNASDGNNSGRRRQIFNSAIDTLIKLRDVEGLKLDDVTEEAFNKYLSKNSASYWTTDVLFSYLLTPEVYYDLGKTKHYNHQILSVEKVQLSEPIDLYDLEVESEFHNFSLASGIITHNCIGQYHPHGTASVDPVVSSLVRWGIFEGQGNHGAKMLDGDDLEPAASRYTEVKISPKWRNILADYMDYVPYKEAEIEGYREPCYLPTPVPLSLAFGSLGIGFGVNMRLPSFTIKSMYQALINDDPYLLEAPFGLTLSKTEGLKDLWTRGLGELEYKYKVYDTALDSGYGTIIEGDPELFKPNLSVFDPWIQQGRVYKINLTKDIGKIFIGRTYNVKAISLDDISDMANKAAIYKKTFRLTVSDGERSYLIPLKNWLINCYNNYYKIVERFRLDNIEKLKFDYLVYSYLHLVVEILYNHRDFNDTDIYNELSKSHDDITIEVIQAILRKNISTIRNTDSTAKLQKIQDKLNYFETLDITNKIKSLIDEF